MDTKASVIVRSFNRLPALLELLDVLRTQKYKNFEIIIVEQSTNYEGNDWEKLNEIEAEDHRIKLLKYTPLGGPKARNEGVKNATGEILIFIDDDDLPFSDQWVAEHVEAYKDPMLIGFTGRHVLNDKTGDPYKDWVKPFFKKKCMRYSYLKFPYTYAQLKVNIKGVEWLHGTNSSVRRKWAIKAGLWDEDIRHQDEHSFAFKLNRILDENHHIDFREKPELIRRTDISGGMNKRNFNMIDEFKNQLNFCFKVIYRYHKHLIILFPFHIASVVIKTVKFKIMN
ncbi:hypothetical protein A8B79_03270 [Balneola sp. EhC07]|uniref:glycosyltransferase family 2 protein n=1 Tax=Balneola sp. EhC07 TaxID=1849360 RepID=UPI0007F4E3FB|nr:glycosyltransferase family 2 protein [Balneola sp. EhC07]OAN62580.1 hypothetical protein A8B79_03270 [Balneola sp. EhC07]